jgi:hypothetical protein
MSELLCKLLCSVLICASVLVDGVTVITHVQYMHTSLQP